MKNKYSVVKNIAVVGRKSVFYYKLFLFEGINF